MCCEERRQPTGLKGTHCIFVYVCEGMCVHVCVCHTRTKGMHQVIFCWQELPRKQRRYSSSFRSEGAQIECVTYSREGDWRRGGWGGGTRNQWESQKVGLSNGHGWNQYSQWISGRSAMPKSPWLFSGSGVAAFQSLLSALVCDLVLLKGLYFSGKRHRKP